MFAQTILPDEIVIADDGSTQDTKDLIEKLRKETTIPIKHVWHEDEGIQKNYDSQQSNRSSHYRLYLASRVATLVLSPHFVSDHLELAEKNYFVCGSRVKLSPETTEKLMASKNFKLNIWNMPASFMLNSLRSKFLRHYMALRYAKKIDHLRGCNMAFWKEDLIKVNGYNEDLLQWGHEDGELAFRLHFAGVKKKALKMGGAVYHLYHKEASKGNEQRHLTELEKVKKEHLSWCENGIDKYLS